MSSKRSSNASKTNTSAGPSLLATNATHLHASSIAIPDQSNIERLESQLTLLSQKVTPFLDRDVTLIRSDDNNPSRVELEANDSSYAPVRRARMQSRLHVHFHDGKVELRAFSQAQSAVASRGSDLVNMKNLIRVELYDTETKEAMFWSTPRHDAYPNDNGGNKDTWSQITSAMGWTPHHTVLRKGHRFSIYQDKTFEVQIFLFRLMQLDTKNEVKPISNTRILQAVIMVTLPSKVEQANAEMASLSQRANDEMMRLQEALKGFVDLTRDVD